MIIKNSQKIQLHVCFPAFFVEIIVKKEMDLELVTSLFKVSEYIPKFSFYSDSWPGHVWCFNSKRFFSYSKNYSW